jgi:putative membrane protein
MRILTLVRSEFARLVSSRMGLLALVALMIVPVVYGGLYLYGNADPYNQLDKVPAAIVVDDTGDYGRDAADQLVEDQRFGWVIVSSDAAAEQGVTDGTYDFSLTFPADFSQDLDSSGDAHPTQASLVLTTNDTNSYLSTTLAKQAAAAVQVVITQQVGEHAARTLLDAVDSIRTGLVDASGGASKLADATATAAAGAQSLASGSSTLASGAQSLNDGLSELDSQAAALPGSATTLAGGAASVAQGAAQAAALSPSIRSQLAAAFAGSTVSPTDQATILGELDALSGGLASVSGGAAQVSAGASALSATAPTLAGAIHSAASGASTLADGAATASTGATDLSAGLTQLSSGATELDDSLADGVDKVPATTDVSRGTTAAAIATPVAVDQHAITEAQNYGAGLAPFFISLAAWIGIYALFLLVRPLSRRALTAVRRPFSTVLAGWITPAALGAVQMVALFAIVTGVLGLQPANAGGMLAFMVLVSATFAAIVLALNVWLGSIGQFLGLLLMIVQLVTAGGTFPWQTLPAPLAFLHQALPMSHAVEGVRQLMYGGDALWGAVWPLLVWLAVALAITVLGARKQGRFRTLRELRPSPLAG